MHFIIKRHVSNGGWVPKTTQRSSTRLTQIIMKKRENNWKLLGDIMGEKKKQNSLCRSKRLEKLKEKALSTTLWQEHWMETLDLNEKNQVRVYSVASAGFSCHFTGSREK